MFALLKVDNIEQCSEVVMQLTTILYLKIPVYDDILQVSRDFWTTNFKVSKAKSLHSRIIISSSQKVKYLKYLIKLFTSTVSTSFPGLFPFCHWGKKKKKGPGTGRSSMYSDWSMTSTLLCK